MRSQFADIVGIGESWILATGAAPEERLAILAAIRSASEFDLYKKTITLEIDQALVSEQTQQNLIKALTAFLGRGNVKVLRSGLPVRSQIPVNSAVPDVRSLPTPPSPYRFDGNLNYEDSFDPVTLLKIPSAARDPLLTDPAIRSMLENWFLHQFDHASGATSSATALLEIYAASGKLSAQLGSLIVVWLSHATPETNESWTVIFTAACRSFPGHGDVLTDIAFRYLERQPMQVGLETVIPALIRVCPADATRRVTHLFSDRRIDSFWASCVVGYLARESVEVAIVKEFSNHFDKLNLSDWTSVLEQFSLMTKKTLEKRVYRSNKVVSDSVRIMARDIIYQGYDRISETSFLSSKQEPGLFNRSVRVISRVLAFLDEPRHWSKFLTTIEHLFSGKLHTGYSAIWIAACAQSAPRIPAIALAIRILQREMAGESTNDWLTLFGHVLDWIRGDSALGHYRTDLAEAVVVFLHRLTKADGISRAGDLLVQRLVSGEGKSIFRKRELDRIISGYEAYRSRRGSLATGDHTYRELVQLRGQLKH